MDPTDLAFAGIARQAELIRDGEVSSRELAQLYLDRIEAINPSLNAFTVVLAERALAEADEADRDSDRERPLRGVPIAIKDVEDVEGVVTAFGTGAFDRPATADGELVRRLRSAGAVIIAKTTLPELAICGFTESEALGDHPQPVEHRSLHRRVVGGQRRRGGRRAGERRVGLRRGRIDSHPGRVLRAVRAQAPTRPAAVLPRRTTGGGCRSTGA